jgi:large subunit ribosomal protein L22
MQAIAKLNNLRIAPRKVRLVVDMVRGKKTDRAQNILKFAKQQSAENVLKLLNSAIANAKNNLQLDPDNLYISKITVDGGPVLKRWMARAKGQTYDIKKRTSNVTVILGEIVEGKKIKKSETAQEKKEEAKTEKKQQKQTAAKEKLDIKKPKVEMGKQRFFRRKSV